MEKMNPKKWLQYVKPPQPPALLKSEPDPARRLEVAKVLANHLPDWNKSGKLLAVGCGDGFELGEFKRLGYSDTRGLTFHDEEQGEGIDYEDMHCMSYEDKSFDYVYSKEVLEHSPSPYIALCEMNRILKDGGEFFHLISCGWMKQMETYHFSCFPDWLWVDLLVKSGFKVTKILDGHETEFGFIGHKVKDKDFNEIPERWAYDLRGTVNSIKREKIRL